MDVRDLSGRVGVVTGAGSGIGRATALELAGRGADIGICDLDETSLADTAKRIEELGRRVVSVRVDVASSEQMSGFAERVYEELRRVDVLVNNAGIGVGGNFLDVPLEEWDAILGINLKGVVNGCYFFVPRMVAAGNPAHIVNIASMAGYVAAPGMTAYSATKFAVLGMSEALWGELADHGIGVTAICPGVINTNIVRVGRVYGPLATEENRERDEVYEEFRSLAGVLISDQWDVYARKENWDRMMKGDSENGKFQFLCFGLLKPTIFEPFKSATVMGAMLTESVMYHWWLNWGVEFEPHVVIDQKARERLPEHLNGERVTIRYFFDAPWSKRSRDMPFAKTMQ